MMHVITKAELPEFVKGLQKHFPRSLVAFHIARNQQTETFAWNGTEIIVDSYPEYSVCLTRQNATRPVSFRRSAYRSSVPPLAEEESVNEEASCKSTIVPEQVKVLDRQTTEFRLDEVSYPTAEYQAVTLFATDKTALENLLEKPGILDWNRKIAFLDVDSDHVDIVQKVSEKYGTADGAEERCRCLMFILPKQIWQKMPAPTLGEGLREGPLETRHIEQIAKEWNVEGRGGDIEGTYPLFQKLIKENFPYVAVFDEKDDLVAYSMYDVVGAASKAYTREDYRNRGIFQYISYALPKKIFEQTGHEMLFGNAYTHNAASLKVLNKALIPSEDPTDHTGSCFLTRCLRGKTDPNQQAFSDLQDQTIYIKARENAFVVNDWGLREGNLCLSGVSCTAA